MGLIFAEGIGGSGGAEINGTEIEMKVGTGLTIHAGDPVTYMTGVVTDLLYENFRFTFDTNKIISTYSNSSNNTYHYYIYNINDNSITNLYSDSFSNYSLYERFINSTLITDTKYIYFLPSGSKLCIFTLNTSTYVISETLISLSGVSSSSWERKIEVLSVSGTTAKCILFAFTYNEDDDDYYLTQVSENLLTINLSNNTVTVGSTVNSNNISNWSGYGRIYDNTKITFLQIGTSNYIAIISVGYNSKFEIWLTFNAGITTLSEIKLINTSSGTNKLTLDTFGTVGNIFTCDKNNNNTEIKKVNFNLSNYSYTFSVIYTIPSYYKYFTINRGYGNSECVTDLKNQYCCLFDITYVQQSTNYYSASNIWKLIISFDKLATLSASTSSSDLYEACEYKNTMYNNWWRNFWYSYDEDCDLDILAINNTGCLCYYRFYGYNDNYSSGILFLPFTIMPYNPLASISTLEVTTLPIGIALEDGTAGQTIKVKRTI